MTKPKYLNTFTFVLPPDRHLPSGGNIYNEKLIEALRTAGHSVEIIDFATYQSAIRQDIPGLFWVDSLFVKEMPSLIPAHPNKAKSFFILHHLESLHPPLGNTSDQIFNRDERAVLHLFNGFLVTSRFSAHYLKTRGFRQPAMVVEPAIDLVELPQLHSGDSVRALMVANIVEGKGILEWLTHLGEVSTASDSFTLTIVGRTDMEPAYAQACQQEVKSNTILQEKVHFTGSLPYPEVLNYYAQSNLFVSASLMETFGMALQEAKAYRIPLLAVKGGYVESHIKVGKNGYIFNSTARMANFFIDLVRDQARFAVLLEQVVQERPSVYTWQQAATSFWQQFNQFFKIL